MGRVKIAVAVWIKRKILMTIRAVQSWPNDNEMLTKIICELIAIKDTSVVTCEQVLKWATLAEAQGPQTVIINSLRETKDLDAITSGWMEQNAKPFEVMHRSNNSWKGYSAWNSTRSSKWEFHWNGKYLFS